MTIIASCVLALIAGFACVSAMLKVGSDPNHPDIRRSREIEAMNRLIAAQCRGVVL